MDIPASPCEFARRGATTARANNAGIRILITTSPLLSWYLRRWGLTIPAASLKGMDFLKKRTPSTYVCKLVRVAWGALEILGAP